VLGRWSASGRLLPVNSVDFEQSERPVLSKADIQTWILNNPLLNGWIAPGSGRSGIIAVKGCL